MLQIRAQHLACRRGDPVHVAARSSLFREVIADRADRRDDHIRGECALLRRYIRQRFTHEAQHTPQSLAALRARLERIAKQRRGVAEGDPQFSFLAGLADLVDIREGDALQTLANNLRDRIDPVLLDGAKGLYPKVLELLESRLRPGALVLADNAEWSPAYLERVRSPDAGYVSVEFAADIELSTRT